MKRDATSWSLPDILSIWRDEFQVYRAADENSAAIRARHMQSIGRLTPLMMTGNVAGAVVLTRSLHGVVSSWQLVPWLVCLLMACGAAMLNWHNHRQSPRNAVSARAVTGALRGALVFGLLWAGATIAWLAVVPHDQQLLLSTLVIGVMCGGAFAMASVPQAAVSFLVVLTVGSVVALARAGGMVHANLQLMVVLYGILLSLCALTTARIYTARLVSEREAARQGELVGLLLRDFEENSADLLWEVGADGRFTHVSVRLAAALASTDKQLQESGLLAAMKLHSPADQPDRHLAGLASALANGRPFKDCVVPVRTAAGSCWWSFTAKPLMSIVTGQVQGWRGVIADVTPARLAHERLEQLAHCDTLTGLANRLQLRERVHQAIDTDPAATQEDRCFALVCLDVDHFKAINDTLGHAVGDAVLTEVARRLRCNLRPHDLAARIGGDEFAVVLDPIGDVDQVHGFVRRIVLALSQPYEFNGHVVAMSVSVGVALAPQHGASLDELLGNADLALYAAKQAGRDRHELFVPSLRERHRRRIALAQELQGALARGELTLAWQPQVHIASWRAVGVEVLLRWQHPELGFVSPAEFIPIAEESGQIVAIGNWVLEQACAGAAALPESMSVSVNASPVQLMRDDFLGMVGLALARSGLAPQRLKIEITESLFMDAVPVALANLHGLRNLGVHIALDDFGTGFSSLAYLLRFPFDLLKIDRAFVLELMARDDARALVRAIVEMAKTLGMGTIAEGVEESEQLEVLRQAGCEAVQGYLVARPMPLKQLHRWLADRLDEPAAGWPCLAPKGNVTAHLG